MPKWANQHATLALPRRLPILREPGRLQPACSTHPSALLPRIRQRRHVRAVHRQLPKVRAASREARLPRTLPRTLRPEITLQALAARRPDVEGQARTWLSRV